MSYKNVALVGATGNLGTPILEALIQSGKFQITVLSRKESKSTLPAGITVKRVDYTSQAELTEALRGVDAVVNNIGDLTVLEDASRTLAAAAIDAGVDRIIPSDFGVDISTSPARELPLFGIKVAIEEHLEELAASGKISYTSISVGPFFDWGLKVGFLGFNIPEKKATLFDNGDGKFNTTNLGTIAQSIVAVLSNPAATKNKHIRISDFFVSQNDILKVLEKKLGSFKITKVDAKKLFADNSARLAKGEFGPDVIYPLIQSSIYAEHEGTSRWGEDDDSVPLGLKRLNFEEELLRLV